MSQQSESRITREILKEAIGNEARCSPETVEILDLVMTDGAAMGDNFACVLKAAEVKAKVCGEEQTFNYMVKHVPKSPFQIKLCRDGKVFEKECLVYKSLLPALEKAGDGAVKLSMPKCFYGSNETEVLVMENLKTQGYTMCKKESGLDIPHIRMVLEELSRLHALSYHYLESYPGGLDEFKRDMPLFCIEKRVIFADDLSEKFYNDTFTKMYGGSATIVQKFGGTKEEVERMKAFAPKLIEVHNEKTKAEGKFQCITHNDSWTNNFMFLYDETGELKDVKLLDLQIMRRGRPTMDLVYLFTTSTDPELREKHLNDLLRYYHDCLISNVMKLGYSPGVYPFEDFMADFDDCFIVGHIVACVLSQVFLTTKTTEKGSPFDHDAEHSAGEQMDKMKKLGDSSLNSARGNMRLQKLQLQLCREAIRRKII